MISSMTWLATITGASSIAGFAPVVKVFGRCFQDATLVACVEASLIHQQPHQAWETDLQYCGDCIKHAFNHVSVYKERVDVSAACIFKGSVRSSHLCGLAYRQPVRVREH